MPLFFYVRSLELWRECSGNLYVVRVWEFFRHGVWANAPVSNPEDSFRPLHARGLRRIGNKMTGKPEFTDMLRIAEIMGTHGLKGDLKVRALNPDTSLLAVGREIFLRNESENDLARHAIQHAYTDSTGLCLRLDGIASIEEAKKLYRAGVYVPKNSLPALANGEFYLSDLIGLNVVHLTDGRLMGVVADTENTGAQECLVVRNEETQKEFLIPTAPGILVRIDPANRLLVVDTPQGIDEL